MLLGHPYSSPLHSHSPLMSGRPSSPLNPHSHHHHHLPSSSPPPIFSSPTPSSSTHLSYQPFHSPAPAPALTYTTPGAARPSRPSQSRGKYTSDPGVRGGAGAGAGATSPRSSGAAAAVAGAAGAGVNLSRSNSKSTTTRYARPSKRASMPSSPDLFSEGTTPTEGAMWRGRFDRRLKERERRKHHRDTDLDRRRGLSDGIEEDERQAEEDDEEIFRRLMVLQRRKAQHAALVAHEDETGGSDPYLPEFWEDEQSSLDREERDLLRRLDEAEPGEHRYGGMPISPARSSYSHAIGVEGDDQRWAREAQALAEAEEAEAEQAERAERAAEEEAAELARRVEEAYALTPFAVDGHSHQEEGIDMDIGGDDDMDMDWAMDIE